MRTLALCAVVLAMFAAVQAGKKMKQCKKDRAALQAELEALQAAHVTCENQREELESTVLALNKRIAESTAIFVTRECGTSNRVTYDAGKYLINTDGGVWANDGWCTVLDDQRGDDDASYSVSVDLYADTEEENHLGIAYNVQDINNYDYVYYRPHSDTRCFQAGYVQNGQTRFDVKGPCPTDLEFKTWFNAEVIVKPGSNTAEFYLNGELTSTAQAMHYSPTAKAGVIMANGYANKAHFKNLDIE